MTPPPARARRVKIRREVNMTAIIITAISAFGVCVALYLIDAGMIARQGLDVRPMLTLPVGPQQWAEVIGWFTGGGVAWRLLKRTNRSEALVGRAVPEALAAGTQVTSAELAALRTLLEQRLPPAPPEHVVEPRPTSRSAHRGAPTWTDILIGRREEQP